MTKKYFISPEGILLKNDGVPKDLNTIPMATICTPGDLMEAVEDGQVKATVLTCQTINEEQDPALEALSRLFDRFEIPIGVISKLFLLKSYDIRIVLDDSRSMKAIVGNMVFESEYMQSCRPGTVTNCSRWMEQEDRVHLLMEFLAHVPTGDLSITFLNRQHHALVLNRGVPAEEKLQLARQFLRHAFQALPDGNTPINRVIASLIAAPRPTMLYLFTDGEPNDASPEAVARLIQCRPDPIGKPISLFPCTTDHQAVAWMDEVDGARYVNTVDDYVTERKQVMDAQGSVFPYSKGFWIMCHLVGAICPEDLDRLDEPQPPISQTALSEMMGRQLSMEEYSWYLRRRPQHHHQQSSSLLFWKW